MFQNCDILVKKGLPPQNNTITSHGGKKDWSQYDFSFKFCNISAAPDLLLIVHSNQTFLERSWDAYAITIFMESYMSDMATVNPFLDTLYYAEYKNYGPGAKV